MLSKNVHLVAMVGMLIPWKGQELFLRAVAQIHLAAPDFHFLIVGQAPEYGVASYRAHLEKLACSMHLERCSYLHR